MKQLICRIFHRWLYNVQPSQIVAGCPKCRFVWLKNTNPYNDDAFFCRIALDYDLIKDELG